MTAPRTVLGVAVAVLLLAEVAVRLVEARLPAPMDWYTTEYATKVEQMEGLLARHGGASVVFLGSSVIDVSIDPMQMKAPATAARPAYNGGLVGANLEMVDFWSEHLVEPALHPEVAVIAVSSRDVNRNGAALESQTSGFYDLPAVRRILGVESLAEQVERRIGETSRLVRHRAALRRPFESLAGHDAPGRALTHSVLGHELHLTDVSYRGDAAVEAFFRSEPLLRFAPSPTQLDALAAMIVRLDRSGVRVIVLDVPVTSRYIALHPNGVADYRSYEVALNGLAAQLAVELVDAGTWPQGSFADPMHLNGAGASALTALVDGYLADDGVHLPPGAEAPDPLPRAVAEPVRTG